MKTVFEISCAVDDLGRTFIGLPTDEEGNYLYLNQDSDEDEYKEAAKISGLSVVALKSLVWAFADMAEEVEDNVRKDLKSIWQRLDEIESRMK